MGRHSSPEQGPFYRSIVAWALPWVMITGVVLVAVWFAIDAVGGKSLGSATEVDPTRSPRPTRTSTPAPTPAGTPEPTPSPKKSRTAAPEEKVELITEGISVQVLNATTAPQADDRMADRLSSLGYRVVAIETASRPYERTTVFWSYPEARPAAEALASKFGWVASEKPDNLSPTVDLHVVVGADEV